VSGSRFLAGRFLLGANYWPRATGPYMWEADGFDEGRIAVELKQARHAGLDVLRCFVFLPTMFRSPGELDPAAFGRFQRFLELCAAAGLQALPTLFVGHMSGENFPFPGQGRRSPYTDGEVLTWQAALARAAAGAAAGQSAVVAWNLSNEMPIFAGDTDVTTATAWAAQLHEALAAADPQRRPIGTGDGLFGLTGGRNGFDPQALSEVVDFLGPHLYPTDADPYRHAAWAQLALRQVTWLGKPVVLEEFGASSAQASDENQALYVRETVLTTMALGGAGAMVWCFGDFGPAVAAQAPYVHHAFELGFGITRADGSEKPACGELRALSRLIERVHPERLELPERRAVLVTPRQLHEEVPFSYDDRTALARTLVQALVLASRAALEVDVVPEDALLRGAVDASRYRLFLLPSTQKLTVPAWELLLDRVRAGAVLYWSWLGGDRDFHQGAWCHRFEELTGCRHRLRYGVPDLAAPDETMDVFEGPTLSLPVAPALPMFSRARLPVDPMPELGDAVELLATDRRGEPALLRHRVGTAGGQVLFLAAPWERWQSAQADVNEGDQSHVLYALAADAAGLRARYASADPRIESHVLHDGADDLVFCLNRSFGRVDCDLDIPGTAELLYPEGGTAWDAFLGKEARVYRVRGARKGG
jgi:endo-1,4-beta-mannosidase